jgi:hypothetical protein
LRRLLRNVNDLPCFINPDKLDQTKVTGVKGVDDIQEVVDKGITKQLGKGGLVNLVGEIISKVFTRDERGGRGEKGGFR